MGIEARGVIAASCGAAFVGLAIGVRAAMQRRRTGSSGIVLSRMHGPVERWVQAGLVAAVALLGAALVAALTGDALGGAQHVSAALVVVGVVLAAGAIGATFWAQLAMGDSWRIGVDAKEHTALVTGGPYAYVRNPIYTAMLAFLVALVLVLPGPVTLLAFVVAFAAIQGTVRGVEEPYLRAHHGAAFDAWCAAAGRFLPVVGRRVSPSCRGC